MQEFPHKLNYVTFIMHNIRLSHSMELDKKSQIKHRNKLNAIFTTAAKRFQLDMNMAIPYTSVEMNCFLSSITRSILLNHYISIMALFILQTSYERIIFLQQCPRAH